MDFYTRQVEARRQTRWLVVAFTIAILAVVVALDLVLFTLFGLGNARQPNAPLQFMRQNPGTALVCSLLALGVVGLSSLFKSLQLRGGGGVVARGLGGVRVDRNTQDLKRKRLHNVVEEMSIASGVPMPEIYVLEHEPAINAFAAGHTPANAAVTVTQGTLDKLNRDELQGVIAHEFSHVLNGDMRLNVQLMGWLFGLFVVALVGRTLLRFAPRGRKGNGGLVFAAFAIMVLGYVGLFFARLLQAAVSRQRERLADASGVQFTRNPEGLKGALVKIAGLAEGSRLVEADAEQTAHMMFAPGLKRFFATHPPLAERIRTLDPHFDVKKLPALAAEALTSIPAFDVAALAQLGAAAARASRSPTTAASPEPAFVSAAALGPATPGEVSGPIEGGDLGAGRPAVATDNAIAVQPQRVSAQVASVDTLHIDQAKALRLALPGELREFIETSGQGRAVALTLLLSREGAVREAQLKWLQQAISADELGAVRDVAPITADLAPLLRLPALLQVFPALRRLPIGHRQALAQLADHLIRADARIDVFEFCLSQLLSTLLRDEIEARSPHGNVSLADAADDLQVLFSVLAQFGASDERQARMAYEAGMHALLPMSRPSYRVPQNWTSALAASLPRLEKLHPYAKKALIEGLVRTIAHDEQLSVAEAELLRTVCATLHCPLPPLLPGFSQSA